MNNIFKLSLLFLTIASFAQSDTEVFLFDLETNNANIKIQNGKNISNNEGYDNQPSFLDERYIIFASTRNGQTDIAKYDTRYNAKIWINHTEGGEYSPLKIPNKHEVSAVRLDTNGKQRLYTYSLSNGNSTELIEDLVVAYYNWYNENTIVSAVIEDKDLNLYTSFNSLKSNRKYDTKIGRSIHKIPNSSLVSYISKKDSITWQIRSLDPLSGKTKFMANTLPMVEDICWLDENTILSGKANRLYKFTLHKDKDWKQIADLSSYDILNITRILVNNTTSKLLVTGDINTSKNENNITAVNTVAPKLENISWISGTWHGEAFGGKTEEIWSEPSAGSMMATFKLINDNKVTFYEIEIIREIENSLILQLKHFGSDLKGWETKDETVDFPLKEITENKVVFEGMTFEKVSETEMNIYVDITDNGKTETVKFNYKKKL
ncbi:DUF6265 family protein [Winogradskyella endarachnes]|uniref:DUF6265 domain-containing protein n=1 Tax=Winogradskyella endarachnes TaxID=2681965 RepID=A0A6L6U7I0_9FLAO|nr:DUF6265 family protein [Winogradskyella endarachnes]MUU78203.1 hypothetical protein [Winogradskyella endarachnes]